MDLGAQFCERCGRDRDSLVSARTEYRDCPACGAACCADCWNQVDGACLVCAPFRLADTTARPRIVVAATAPAPETAGDPYSDLRGAGPTVDSWDATWGTARQRPRDAAPAGRPPDLAPDAWRAVVAARVAEEDAAAPAKAARRRPRKRAGRFGLAAAVAWVVVAALAVAALGATPAQPHPQPATAASPAPTPVTTPPPPPTPLPTARPTREPRATPVHRAIPAPGGDAETTRPWRATPKPVPKPTKKPSRPVVVAPPPAPTPDLSPGATPGG